MASTVLGVGYAPSRLQLNAERGMDLQAIITFCENLPTGTTAELKIVYPQANYVLTVPITISSSPATLTFIVSDTDVNQIPYCAHAEIWFTYPSNPPFICGGR